MGVDPPAPFHPGATRRVRALVQVHVAVLLVESTSSCGSNNNNNNNNNVVDNNVIGSTANDTSIVTTTNVHDNIMMTKDNDNNNSTKPIQNTINESSYIYCQYDIDHDLLSLPTKKVEVFETIHQCANRVVMEYMNDDNLFIQQQQQQSNRECIHVIDTIHPEDDEHIVTIVMVQRRFTLSEKEKETMTEKENNNDIIKVTWNELCTRSKSNPRSIHNVLLQIIQKGTIFL